MRFGSGFLARGVSLAVLLVAFAPLPVLAADPIPAPTLDAPMMTDSGNIPVVSSAEIPTPDAAQYLESKIDYEQLAKEEMENDTSAAGTSRLQALQREQTRQDRTRLEAAKREEARVAKLIETQEVQEKERQKVFAYDKQVEAEMTQPLESDGGIVVNTAEEANRREVLTNSRVARRKPNAVKFRYYPQENDPLLDPFNQEYSVWLNKIESKAQKTQADKAAGAPVTNDMKNNVVVQRDEDYEQFIRSIGVLLFSLGEKQLSDETRSFIKAIPAGKLASAERSLEPKHPVTIIKDPDEIAFEKMKDQGVDMNISVKSTPNSTLTFLEMGYDALQTGQMEGAQAIYKKVLTKEPDNTQALFGLATAYHRSGQLEQARDAYLKLLKLDNQNWPALNNFLILAGEEAPEDALRELKELEQANPEFSPIAAQLGLIYLRVNRPMEAAKYFTRAVTLSPDNLHYRYNLAILLDYLGNKEQAARLYKQVIDAGYQGKEIPESIDKVQDRLAMVVSEASK